MNKFVLCLSAFTAFVLGAGGALMAVVASGYALNSSSWVVAGITGFCTMAKDIRSQLALPPIGTNGGLVTTGSTTIITKSSTEVKPPTI